MTDKIYISNLYKEKKYQAVIYSLSTLKEKDVDLIQFLSGSYYGIGNIEKSYEILIDNINLYVLNELYFKNLINLTNKTKNFYKTLIVLLKNIHSQKLIKKITVFQKIEIGKLHYINNKQLLSNKHYQNILNIKNYKDNGFVHFHIGKNYYELSNKLLGEKYLRKAINLNSNIGEFYRFLSMNKKFTDLNDEDLKKMLFEFSNEKNREIDKINIGFGISKAYEDLNDYEQSSKYLRESNQLMNKHYNYAHKTTLSQNENLKKLYIKNFKNHNFTKYGYKNAKHIFIVGMPRSGTTLLEKIISSHKDVFNGGELSFFSKHFNGKFNQIAENNMEVALEKFDQSYLEEIGQGYSDDILKKTNGIITDKMPFNFIYLGFIKQAMPNSIIVHIQRDRNDNILSIYKNFFATEGIQFAYDEKHVNDYYDSYENLMNFWKQNCPGFFYDIKYESLIENFEIEVRNLIKNCQLDWDEACLSPEKNKSFVKTLSVSQAREKVYASSVKKYEMYKSFLPQLFK